MVCIKIATQRDILIYSYFMQKKSYYFSVESEGEDTTGACDWQVLFLYYNPIKFVSRIKNPTLVAGYFLIKAIFIFKISF